MVKANHYKISSFPDGTPLIKKDLDINYLNVISIVWTFESMAELPTVIMIAKDANVLICSMAHSVSVLMLS